MEKRIAYGDDGRELLDWKQNGNTSSPWEWCAGAMHTMLGKMSMVEAHLPEELLLSYNRHPHDHKIRHHMRHEVFHAIHKQPPNTFEQSEYQAALFEHFRELDSRVYTRHKILGKAFQLLPVPTAPAAAPSASAVSSRRSSDAVVWFRLRLCVLQLGKVGKWKVLENAASRVLTRGKRRRFRLPMAAAPW